MTLCNSYVCQGILDETLDHMTNLKYMYVPSGWEFKNKQNIGAISNFYKISRVAVYKALRKKNKCAGFIISKNLLP